ncbi:MAG: hypothetical protein K2L73_00995 [Muribaculaceae bacterium]|nr:hypothetical protein [Muribaculaceae bacterium]
MTSVRRILSWPGRRWRSRGFGIHSPFAYSFVTETLAAKGAGECEEAIKAIAGKDFRRLSLLYRCVRHLRPDSIALYPEDDATARHVIALASPERNIKVISAADNATETPGLYFIADIDREPSRSVWDSITARHTRGMDFSDMRTGLLCPYPHLPRQSFRIVFR